MYNMFKIPMLFVYRFLWLLHLVGLFNCFLYMEIYLQTFNCVSFWLHCLCGEWEGWARKPANHTILVAVFSPIGRTTPIINHRVIEFLVAFLCWHLAFLPFLLTKGIFVIGLSQISSFSLDICYSNANWYSIFQVNSTKDERETSEKEI